METDGTKNKMEHTQTYTHTHRIFSKFMMHQLQMSAAFQFSVQILVDAIHCNDDIEEKNCYGSIAVLDFLRNHIFRSAIEALYVSSNAL